jgi:hypothetical protein
MKAPDPTQSIWLIAAPISRPGRQDKEMRVPDSMNLSMKDFRRWQSVSSEQELSVMGDDSMC